MSVNSCEYDRLYKIVVTGAPNHKFHSSDRGVGVSNLISRFVEDKFDLFQANTYRAEYKTKNIEVEGKVFKAQLWDGFGGSRGWYNRSEYRGADAYILIYSINEMHSFQAIPQELANIRDRAREDSPIFLVGNKSDLVHLRDVSTDEAQAYAKQEGLHFIETSALNSSNVNELFTRVVTTLYNRSSSVAGQKIKRAVENQPETQAFMANFQVDLREVLIDLQTDIAGCCTFNGGHKQTANSEFLQLRDEIEGKQFTAEDINKKIKKIFERHPEIYRIDYVRDFIAKYFDGAPQSYCSVM
ncbi:MAG: GTP-binding protein [Chlamydiales bacterium]|nr:GTP-binding protein [Chlamydiales bacterium]